MPPKGATHFIDNGICTHYFKEDSSGFYFWHRDRCSEKFEWVKYKKKAKMNRIILQNED